MPSSNKSLSSVAVHASSASKQSLRGGRANQNMILKVVDLGEHSQAAFESSTALWEIKQVLQYRRINGSGMEPCTPRVKEQDHKGASLR